MIGDPTDNVALLVTPPIPLNSVGDFCMRRSSLATRLIAAALTSLAPPVLLAQSMSVDIESGTWALTNARIETVTKGTIAKGTIVIRNGVIDAVGANVTPPPDARVMDLSGKTVYPGFIDLTSTMGLTTEAPAGGRGGRGGGGLNLPPGVTPEMVAAFLGQAPTQQEGPAECGARAGTRRGQRDQSVGDRRARGP